MKHYLPKDFDVGAARQSLAKWFNTAQRDLPWRRNRSLYHTVVSEFMLQQTQVKTVVPYFQQWVKKFPDFAALAEADEHDVLVYWQGLGYYRRARNLHALAKALVASDDPPVTPTAWQKLPGIGPYTAAAICSISFNTPEPVVDGNVVRILSRICARQPSGKQTQAVKQWWATARAFLDPKHSGRHNEALMELGALVCRKQPACDSCPLSRQCKAFQHGNPKDYPQLHRQAIHTTTCVRLWIHHSGKLLLYRHTGDSSRLANMHELPAAENLPSSFGTGKLLKTFRRGISNQRIVESIHLPANLPTPANKSLPKNSQLRWVPIAQLPHLALSGPHRRWINSLLASELRSSE